MTSKLSYNGLVTVLREQLTLEDEKKIRGARVVAPTHFQRYGETLQKQAYARSNNNPKYTVHILGGKVNPSVTGFLYFLQYVFFPCVQKHLISVLLH